MTARHWTEEWLVALDACPEAVAWARGYPTLRAAWAACERADWMLWLADRLAGPWGSASHRQLAGAAVACAETARRHWREEDRGVLGHAIDLAARYGAGERVTREALRSAAAAAAAAAAVVRFLPDSQSFAHWVHL